MVGECWCKGEEEEEGEMLIWFGCRSVSAICIGLSFSFSSLFQDGQRTDLFSLHYHNQT